MSKLVAVNRLSTVEFVTAVHALSPAVAVFDCDGTLWSGDAGSGFMNWTIETGLVSREATDWIDGRYRGYLKGEVSEVAICGEMVQMYQRLREEEMRRGAKVFFEKQVERNIFPEMRTLVEAGKIFCAAPPECNRHAHRDRTSASSSPRMASMYGPMPTAFFKR